MAYKVINCGDHRKIRTFSKIRNTYELNDLLEENRRLKTLNVNTKNSLMKLANENKNLKIKLRKDRKQPN